MTVEKQFKNSYEMENPAPNNGFVTLVLLVKLKLKVGIPTFPQLHTSSPHTFTSPLSRPCRLNRLHIL